MEGLGLAYRVFVRLVAEYGAILMMGASATQLSKLNCMQHFAEQLCSMHFIPLERHRYPAAIGLLCKLLDGSCREHLQRLCPSFLSSILLPRRSQRLNIPRPFLLASCFTTTSLDLFCRSFLGCCAELWNTTQLDHICSNVCQSWTELARSMQHVICNVDCM